MDSEKKLQVLEVLYDWKMERRPCSFGEVIRTVSDSGLMDDRTLAEELHVSLATLNLYKKEKSRPYQPYQYAMIDYLIEALRNCT